LTTRVSISTEGGGEAFWDGSKETFQLVAKDTDRYKAEIVLDYEFKHDEPRQVFYQVFAQDRILVMEGNWVHEGFTFCKIIDFFIEEAPTELTPQEIVEINNQFNSEFRKEVAKQNTTVQTALLIVGITIVVIGILSTTYFIIIIISQRSMARISKKPAKKTTGYDYQCKKTCRCHEIAKSVQYDHRQRDEGEINPKS